MSNVVVETYMIYAVKDGRPPEIWSSEWTFFDGTRVVGGDVPSDFTQASESTYLDAERQQIAWAERGADLGAQAERQALSTQRKALVAAGLTLQQAQILLPDPLGDYSIDEL